MAANPLACGRKTLQYAGPALIEAACSGHVEALRLLVDSGADLEVKDLVSSPAATAGTGWRSVAYPLLCEGPGGKE